MKCDICGIREAVVFVQQVSQDSSSEIHYCRECALKAGINIDEHNPRFSLSSVMSHLFQEVEEQAKKITTCPSCGISLSMIKKTGKAGCPDCYRNFKNDLLQIAKKSHPRIRAMKNASEVSPKISNNIVIPIAKNNDEKNVSISSSDDISEAIDTVIKTGEKEQLHLLKQDLSNAVSSENYEVAAQIRDKIAALMNNSSSQGEI